MSAEISIILQYLGLYTDMILVINTKLMFINMFTFIFFMLLAFSLRRIGAITIVHIQKFRCL